MDTDISKKLEETFEYSAIWFLERLEDGWDLTAEQSRSVHLYFDLAESVEKIPPALMQDTGELAAKYPDVFQRSLDSFILSVGDRFRPSTAAEFVQHLNAHIRAKEGRVAGG
jgi:hypothetical protein